MNTPLDIEALRDRLRAHDAPESWTSLEDVARTPEFEAWAAAEFPTAWAEAQQTETGRRTFLKVMGASIGFAGLTSACVKQPEEKIYPYVRQPEELVPGKPLFYASGFERAGYGVGVLVETHMYRPTHITGNPSHPDSLGATSTQVQASVLDAWDPDRSRNILSRGNTSSWGSFLVEMSELLPELSKDEGKGLRVLTGAVGSPALQAQLDTLLRTYPKAKLHHWEPVSRAAMYAGSRKTYGEPLEVRFDLSKARCVFALDADFMGQMPGGIRHQAELIGRRNDFERVEDWGRLYVAEPTLTEGGAAADNRLRIKGSEVGAVLAQVGRALGVDAKGPQTPHGVFIDAVVEDLRQAGARAAVIVGDDQPAEVHALALAINHALGAVGTTVFLTEPVLAQTDDPVASLSDLVDAMGAGEVDTLLILGPNPVYTAPADIGFADALTQAKLRVHVGHTYDETAELCQWHIPQHHFLESWGDVRAVDGTVTLVQPTMQPLHASHSFGQVIGAFLGRPKETDYERLEAHWKKELGKTGFSAAWRRALHDGVVEGTAFPPRFPELVATSFSVEAPLDGLEIDFDADPNVFDGRYANNAWLQELPRPSTKISWDNALLLSPATAERLGVAAMDRVSVKVDQRELETAVWVLPGQADDAATMHLGFGRRQAGRVGEGVGFDAYPLRSRSAPSWAAASVEKLEGRYPIASTQDHFRMNGRALVRGGTVADFKADPAFPSRADHVKMLTLWEPYAYKGRKWGMSINLSACTGCNSCVVACQSENNISVVGKDEVLNGREMHWIRIDRYFQGEVDDPSVVYQPLMCVMCENAPCETVCPVNATVHGPEGLNQMVYNRCVGTRYCSNNCPYKVRRFNFRLYADFETETLKGQRNPDVSVRSRGVMEKCTYCVQRINRASIQARVDGEELPTDSVKTACQEACPTGALVFGDLNDEKSEVAKRAKHSLNYSLLKELNTKPRTTYLARVTNPNPKLQREKVHNDEH